MAPKKEKTFKEIENETKEKRAFEEEFIEYAHAYSEEAEYEQNRKDDKKVLREIAYIYSLQYPEDEVLTGLCGLVKSIADTDVTSDKSYWKEGKAFASAIKIFDAYLTKLDKEEAALNKASKKLFTKKTKDKKTVWLTGDEIQADEKLARKDHEFAITANTIDEKRRMVAELKHALEAQKDGKLVVDVNEKFYTVNAVGKKFDNVDRSLSKPGRFAQSIGGMTFDRKDYSIFPHEPNANDISQGGLGDCYLLSSLSNIARLYPEQLKESIRENADGKTVTVRLFSKGQDNRLTPVYVTISKESSSFGGLLSNGAENCLWATYFERALIASGLYASYEAHADHWEPVPENIEEIYNQIKTSEANGFPPDEDTYKKYPWLFRPKGGRYELMPWPNYNSIIGGRMGVAAEMIMGGLARHVDIDLENINVDGKKKQDPPKYINMDVLDPDKFVAFTLMDSAMHLTESNFDRHTKTADFSGTREELFRRAAVITENNSNNEETIQAWIKAERLYTDRLRKLLPKDGPLTREIFAAAVKKVSQKCEDPELEPYYMAVEQGCRTNAFRLVRKPYSKDEEALYAQIKEGEKKGYLMGAGSKHDERKIKTGVFGGHAYSLIGAYTDEKSGRKFVKLRNPWGIRENKLVTLIDGNTNGVTTIFNENGTRRYEKSNEKNGYFELELKDFIHDFDTVYLNKTIEKENLLETVHDKKDYFAEMGVFRDKDALKTFFYKNMIISAGSDGNFFDYDLSKLSREKWAELFGEAAAISQEKKNGLLAEASEDAEEEVNDPQAKERMKVLKDEFKRQFENFSKYFDDKIDKFYEDVKTKADEEIPESLSAFMEGTENEIRELTTDPGKTDLGVVIYCKAMKNFRDTVKLSAEKFANKNPKEVKPVDAAYERLNRELSEMKAKGRAETIYVVVKDETKKDIRKKDSNILLNELFVNENGVRMAKIKDGNFDRTMPFGELYESANRFELNKEAPIAEKLQNKGPKETGRIDYKTMRSYLGLVDNLCNAYSWTDKRFDNSSDAYKDLRDSLKEVRHSMLRLNGQPYEKLTELLEGLDGKITAYEDRCARSPKNNWRRNTRVKITNMLKDTIAKAKDMVEDPAADIRKDYAKRLISLVAKKEKKVLSEDMLTIAADRLCMDKNFKTRLDGVNLFQVNMAKPKDFEKQFDEYFPKKEMFKEAISIEDRQIEIHNPLEAPQLKI